MSTKAAKRVSRDKLADRKRGDETTWKEQSTQECPDSGTEGSISTYILTISGGSEHDKTTGKKLYSRKVDQSDYTRRSAAPSTVEIHFHRAGATTCSERSETNGNESSWMSRGTSCLGAFALGIGALAYSGYCPSLTEACTPLGEYALSCARSGLDYTQSDLIPTATSLAATGYSAVTGAMSDLASRTGFGG